LADIRQLRYFVAAVECASLTGASERLSVAQPALGLAIRKLEAEFGVALLVRHSRGIAPTEAGRELLRRAQGVLREFDGLRMAMRELGNGAMPRGRVVLGATPSIGNLLGTTLLAHAAESLPEVRIALIEALSDPLIERVAEGACDLALLRDLPEAHRAVRGEALARESMHLVERGPAAGGTVRPGGVVRLRDLTAMPLALPCLVNEPLARRLLDAAKAAGHDLNVAYEVPAMAMLRPLLLESRCAGILPYGTFLPEIRAGLLTAARIIDPPIERVMFLAYPSGRPLTRAEHALRGLIRAEVAALAKTNPAPWRID
jgi:LysR family nitrogen assimilation transcriptional regulator